MSDPPVDESDGQVTGYGQDTVPLVAAVVCERLRAGRPTRLRIHGRSMYPYLIPGQFVLVEPCSALALRPGDLVAFEQENQVILHRVLAIDASAGLVVEKGDNVRYAGTIEASQTLGRAEAVLAGKPVDLSLSRHTLPARVIAWLGLAQHRVALRAKSRPIFAWPLLASVTVVLRSIAFIARPSRQA